jgi:UDPglucose 6-dehydrogenase
MKIGFIGIGKLGLSCAEKIAECGYSVEGYDITQKNTKNVSQVSTIEEVVADKEIVFVAVPTPHDSNYDGRNPTSHLPPKDFYYDVVKSVLAEANDHMNENQVLVLISTVIPGTIRSEIIPLITNTQFTYNPYLIAMGSVSWDMVNPEMVIIGTETGSNDDAAKKLVNFYKTIMQNDPRYVLGTWDEAEAIKIFYNTFISTKISLVNMIQDVAEIQGNIDVDVVTEALAQSDMRIMGPQYMKAGMGDGGGCHPRDNIALRHMAQKLGLGYDLFASIMGAREMQAKNLAKLLVELADTHNKNIYIHGKSYKPDVDFLDGSYSILVAYYCEEIGFDVTYVDPLTGDDNQPEEPCVILLAHSPSTTYRYTTKETEKADQLYCKIPDGSIVVDPWRKYVNENCKVIHYGNTRYNRGG